MLHETYPFAEGRQIWFVIQGCGVSRRTSMVRTPILTSQEGYVSVSKPHQNDDINTDILLKTTFSITRRT